MWKQFVDIKSLPTLFLANIFPFVIESCYSLIPTASFSFTLLALLPHVWIIKKIIKNCLHSHILTMEMSSKIIPNWAERSVSCSETLRETFSRWVMSSPASYLAWNSQKIPVKTAFPSNVATNKYHKSTGMGYIHTYMYLKCELITHL